MLHVLISACIVDNTPPLSLFSLEFFQPVRFLLSLHYCVIYRAVVVDWTIALRIVQRVSCANSSYCVKYLEVSFFKCPLFLSVSPFFYTFFLTSILYCSLSFFLMSPGLLHFLDALYTTTMVVRNARTWKSGEKSSGNHPYAEDRRAYHI